jgi:hypothetical protein
MLASKDPETGRDYPAIEAAKSKNYIVYRVLVE